MECLHVLLLCIAGFNFVAPRTVSEEHDERLFPWMFPPFGDKKALTEKVGRSYEDFEGEWPWALMEFSTFVGRCDHGQAMLDVLGLGTPVKGVMTEGCPIAYEVADWLKEAGGERIRQAEKHFEKIFHIFQCANLMGEVENIERIMNRTITLNPTYSVFLRDATPLFEVCTRLFPTVENEIVEFKQALNKIMDYVTMTEGYRPYTETSKRRYPYAGIANHGYPYAGIANHGYPYAGIARRRYPYAETAKGRYPYAETAKHKSPNSPRPHKEELLNSLRKLISKDNSNE